MEVKPLVPSKPKPPPFWTIFLDGADPPSFSYARIVGFLVITLFLFLSGYLSITTGALVVPSKEWVYILVAFSLMKPLQRYAETKDNEAQLNFDFQMAQLNMNALASPTPPPLPPPPQPPPVVVYPPQPVVSNENTVVQMQ